jgi:hypothetical protein
LKEKFEGGDRKRWIRPSRLLWIVFDENQLAEEGVGTKLEIAG